METDTADAIERWQGRLNTVLIEYLIFSALSNTPTYGGEIVTYSQKYLNNVKVPTVYSIIRRSIDLNLITKADDQEKADVTRGTARQYYNLTTEGMVYFKAIRDYLLKVTSDNTLTKLEDVL